MSDELAKLSLALSYPGPGGENRKVPTSVLEAPFQAINVGRIDIPDGTLEGAPLVIPFGSVGVGASLLLIKNGNNQDMALLLAGATEEHCRIPPGGVFLIGGSVPSSNALTEATLMLTDDQVGDGSVDYWVFGDSGDQSPSSAGLSLLDAVLAAFAGTAAPLDMSDTAAPGTAERFAREDHVHSDQTGRLHGPDATTLPGSLNIRGGKPSTANHGKEPINNIIFNLGFGAQSTNGESGQIHLAHGDNDVSADADKGGQWTPFEVGWVDQYGYDPAPSETGGTPPSGGAGSLWRENTPAELRMHLGYNPITLKGIRWIMSNFGGETITEAKTYLERTILGKLGWIVDAFAAVAETSSSSGDGSGGYEYVYNRRTVTVGATGAGTGIKALFKGGVEIVASGEFAHVECTVIEHTAGGTREIYRFSFGWLGAYGDDPSSVVCDFHALSNRYKSMAGKVAITNDGAGNETITVTGTTAETTTWTLWMKVIKEIP